MYSCDTPNNDDEYINELGCDMTGNPCSSPNRVVRMCDYAPRPRKVSQEKRLYYFFI